MTASASLNIVSAIALMASLFFMATAANPSQPNMLRYDPWMDANEDGKINVLDMVSLAGVYSSAGDPPKNVTVTNWPTKPPQPKTIIVCQNYTVTYNPTEGYYYWLPFTVSVEEHRHFSIFVAYKYDATEHSYAQLDGLFSCLNMTINDRDALLQLIILTLFSSVVHSPSQERASPRQSLRSSAIEGHVKLHYKKIGNSWNA